jgi:hypothetical protein
MVPGGVPDVFQVVVLAAGPDTPLAGDGLGVRPFILTHEHQLELNHAGIGEEQGGVILGDEGRTVDDGVSFAFKEPEELLSNFATFHEQVNSLCQLNKIESAERSAEQ